MITKAMCIGLLLAAAASSLDAQQTTRRAKLEDGTTVLLFADGTWRADSAPVRPKPSTGGYARPGNASQSVSMLKQAAVSYDPNKWKQTTAREPGRFTFTHTSGDGYAMVIFERIQLTPEGLKRIVLGNAREAAPDARITFEESRVVNGVKVTCLQFEGTVQDIPLRYYGYYYAGKAGTIQVLTYTGNSLFEEYEADFTEFLNGFQPPRS